MDRFILIRLIAFVAALLPLTLHAQHWKALYHPSSYDGQAPCAYFINIDTGFLYDHKQILEPNNAAFCYRTTNAGVDWYPVDAFDQRRYTMRQMWFATRDRGYVIADTAYPTNMMIECGLLFETSDAGVTWRQISPTWMNAKSVYATGKTIFVTTRTRGYEESQSNWEGTFPHPDSASIFRSTDLGVTWDSMVAGPTLPNHAPLLLSEIVGNRDSLVCVLGCDVATQTYFLHSEDLGNTWRTEKLENLKMSRNPRYELQAYCLPYSCRVIRVLDDSLLDRRDSFALYEATPPFTAASWTQILDAEIGGWFAGTPCVQYISNANYTFSGYIRMMNGDTARVGGPDQEEVDDFDYRNICVVGHGAVAYATPVSRRFGGRPANEIDRTTDGGDGALSAEALSPKLAFTLTAIAAAETGDEISICDTATLILTDQNLACSIAKLDSVTVSGLAAQDYEITTHRGALCSGTPDTTYIGIRKSSSAIGAITITAHFTDDDLNAVDTSFLRTLRRPASRIGIAFGLPTTSAVARAGDTLRIPVTLTVDPDAPVTIAGRTVIKLSASYDQNLLSSIDFASGIAGMTVIGFGPGDTSFTIMAPDNFSTRTADTLGVLLLAIRLADSIHTNFTLSVDGLSSEDPRCIMPSSPERPLDVTLSEQCGDPLMRDYMRTNSVAVAIRSIVPNPATDHLIVRYDHANGANIRYRLIDALGALRDCDKLPETATEHRINTSGLPSGLYQLELASSNGQRVTRAVVITR